MFGKHKRGQEDFSEELRAHIALEADRLRQEGLSPREAYETARRNLGNIVSSQERFYESSRWIWFDHLRQDLRYAVRQLAKSKGFTLVAVLTLALGIGANTAVFTLVNAVMLQALPVARPGELYRLGDNNNCCVISGYSGRYSIFSFELYRHLRDHTPEFTELAAFQAGLPHFSVHRSGADSPPEPFAGEFVSGNYFTMFGVRPAAGRMLTSADDTPGATPVAIMSYRAWQQRYALDPSVVGSSFNISGVPFTIAGIAPPGFFGDTLRSNPPDFWAPLASEPAIQGQNSLLHRDDERWLYVIGRVKPGAKLATLEAEVNLELKQWTLDQAGSQVSAADRKAIDQQHIYLASAAGGVSAMKANYADGLRLLMVVSGLVLLIACANLANLLLARGAASRIQSCIRLALGAPRSRLVRQTLTESLLLALLGGLAGLLVASIGAEAILVLAFRGADYVPIHTEPSRMVLGFAFLLSLATGLVFGIAPAWIAARFEPADILRGANRSTANATLPQKSLVVVQAALSLVLLAYAGVLTQSLRNLEHQQFGFETSGRVVAKVNSAFAGYSPERLQGLYRQLTERLKELPGVQSVALSLYSPMDGNNWASGISIEGRPVVDPRGRLTSSSWDRVSAHHFETVGTPLVRGRVMDERDTPNAPHVAVVNEAFVQRFMRNENPIGQHFGIGGPEHGRDYEIVGVVADAKYREAREPAWPMFFLPLLQLSPAEWKISAMARSNYVRDIELRISGDTRELEAALRRTIAGVDPNLTVQMVLSLEDQLRGNFNQERLLARLTALYGLLALLLASVGIYGVTAYSVARRTSEIGIRMALGAARGEVIHMVLRSAILQVGLGLAIGIPAAIAGGRVLANKLYGIQGHDPLMLGGAVLVLAACALVAGLIPAYRAAGIDPLRALRKD